MVTGVQTCALPISGTNGGDSVKFDKVLLVVDGDAITLGAPVVSGALVEAKIVKHGRHDKVRIQKFHRRKRYRRVKGHKQDYTEIEVMKISL
jgi:large subunit ribosomal protein L21